MKMTTTTENSIGLFIYLFIISFLAVYTLTLQFEIQKAQYIYIKTQTTILN